MPEPCLQDLVETNRALDHNCSEMPRYSLEALRFIFFDRSDERCHLCHRRLQFDQYGRIKSEYGWEVDHSNARAQGGSNRLNNLKAACISCNRSKRTRPSSTFRYEKGYIRAPLSRRKRKKAESNAAITGLVGGAVADELLTGGIGHVITGLGALLGPAHDPNESAKRKPRKKKRR